MARRYLGRGDTDGRLYRDENGILWDDEGHGTGPDGRSYELRNGKPVAVNYGSNSYGSYKSSRFAHAKIPYNKIYHKVEYADKDAAKAEGMRWDPSKKKWYHGDSLKSKASKFPLHEELGEGFIDRAKAALRGEKATPSATKEHDNMLAFLKQGKVNFTNTAHGAEGFVRSIGDIHNYLTSHGWAEMKVDFKNQTTIYGRGKNSVSVRKKDSYSQAGYVTFNQLNEEADESTKAMSFKEYMSKK